ncbi:MAG: hypothetical protein OXS30_04180 [Chloroflexota bacterium]|nr:hypothetical protein [Chloroflexota bacterium]
MVTDQAGKRTFLQLSEVRESFDDVIARVEVGESVAIMRDGEVVAELLPGSEPKDDPETRREAYERFLEERAKWPRTNITREEILSSRHEGHRV